ncbi:biotin/lipoyl-binding carrier protein [Leucobacter rhizosphaerae]|uniref:Biotin/lipoyl-binding carrier protein n=1 Tax=Leucobacter rhizosphaerae TaxID=2932245 RepID=A0ABY4FU70_9MICO|nr:biotin/lipoyl-binding carrier protein [Leucobacter rhizosphaerae]UOQ59831.1 biotin/lipoyl-binding carrier protein [Leucobacter rhizosphaerae]
MSVEVTAEMNATVWKITAQVGESLGAEDPIMILESMKMEIPVEAERASRLIELHVAEGESVIEGQLLATIE